MRLVRLKKEVQTFRGTLAQGSTLEVIESFPRDTNGYRPWDTYVVRLPTGGQTILSDEECELVREEVGS